MICLADGDGSRLSDVRKRLGRPSGEGQYGLVLPVLRLSQLRTCLGRPQGFLAGDPPRHATREARWPARGIGRPGQQLGRGCCVCCCASTSPRCRCVVGNTAAQAADEGARRQAPGNSLCPTGLSPIPRQLSSEDHRCHVMAAVQHCPACRKSGAFHLVRESTDSFFRYYGCLCCGHLWGLHKDHPRLLFHVTPVLERKREASPRE